MFSSTGVVIILLVADERSGAASGLSASSRSTPLAPPSRVVDVHDLLFVLLHVGVLDDLLLLLVVHDIPDDSGGSSR